MKCKPEFFLPVFLRIQHPCSCQDYTANPGFLGNYTRGTGIPGYNSEILVGAKPRSCEVSYFEGMHSGIPL